MPPKAAGHSPAPAPTEEPLARPISEQFTVDVWNQIRHWCDEYKRTERIFVAWVRASTEVNIETTRVEDKTRVDMVSFKQGVKDIVDRAVVPPPQVMVALRDTISRRMQVSACFDQVEGDDPSDSTVRHRNFVAELIGIKDQLNTIATPASLALDSLSISDTSKAISYDVLTDEVDITLEGDDVTHEMKIISQGVWQIAYCLLKSMGRYKYKLKNPGDFAEAAWVVLGANYWAGSLCDDILGKANMNLQGLLNLMTEMHADGKNETLQMLPIHEYMKQFELTAKEVVGRSSSAVAKYKALETAEAKTIQNHLQNPELTVAHTHTVLKRLLLDTNVLCKVVREMGSNSKLMEDWFIKVPLGLEFQKYVDYPTKANEMKATLETVFLLQTAAVAYAHSENETIETMFIKVTEFANSVQKYIDHVIEPSLAYPLFGELLRETLIITHDLCGMAEARTFSTATCLPWTLGNRVLGILEYIDQGTTPTMLHQDRVVGVVIHAYNALRRKVNGFGPINIFEILRTMLQTEMFQKKTLPAANFRGAFLEYVNGRPPVEKGLFTSDNHQRGSPSIVHQYPSPSKQDDLYKKLRRASVNPSSLPNAATWHVAERLDQLRYTAAQEFNGAIPVARVNFIAVFLQCIEVLTGFDDLTNTPLNAKLAARMVDRTVKILERLDSTGTTAINATTGDVAKLITVFRRFENRTLKKLQWENL